MACSVSPVSTPEDLKAAVLLFEAYALSLGIDLTFQDFSTEMASMPGKYAPPTGALFLARGAHGEPLGCIGLRPLAPDGVCEMKRLYVSPAGRGLGVGKDLVGAVTQEARRLGYRQMRLDTLPSMASAISLYKKAGFEEIAPYYDTPLAGTKFLELRLD